ncbi:MAG: thiol reductant ABC exporter subunit CydC [Anaerolineae bacterium]|nr:thiol reductant ABC exporter subunit CydC [Anaerolineae bacterium]
MNRNPLFRILRLALPFWRGMTLATLLGALAIASSVSLMATSAWLISKAALQPSIAELSVAVVGVRFFGIARGVFRYLERLVSHETTFRLLAHLRVEFYKAIEPLAPARLISLRSGDLLSRVIDDIENLQNLYLRAVAPPLIAIVLAALLTLFLNLFDPLIALTALLFMLAAGILVPLLAWWGNEQSGKQRVTVRGELNATLVDYVQGMAETLVYGQTHSQLNKIQSLSQQLVIEEHRLARFDALQLAFSVFLTGSAALAVLTIAIPKIDGVYLATVTLAVTAIFEAFTPLAQAAVHLGANAQAAQRLFEIADMPPVVIDPVSTTPIPNQPTLEIKDLSFRYAADAPLILDSISLSLQPGQRIAILGESGSGKSTLVNVLLRFWDYDSGQIVLDGRELHKYAQTDVRNLFGVMTQRTHLFNTTIRENIHIARMDASYEEIEMAAQQAQIHDFILSLPDGYDTYVGENGSQLSGGERQRIALARVLLKNAPILILDEATANLDLVTEQAVMETILHVTAGHSLLIFTHRHIFLDQMDQIYLIHKQRLSPYKPQSNIPKN